MRPGKATPGDVLCAGRLYADLVFSGLDRMPTLGTEVFSQGLNLHPGGGAANTAATLAALGQGARLFSVLPAEPFGSVVLARLMSLGVDTAACVAAAPGTPPQVTAALPVDGDRAFVTYKGGVACPPLRPDTLPGIGHLHIGELRSLQEQPSLIPAARAAGWTVSLDCGWDDVLLAQGGALVDLIGAVDLFLPNQEEWQALIASGLPDAPGPLIVIKCGADGARAMGPTGWVQVAGEPVPVVDPTGAGDAFIGGFLAAWRRGAPLEACLRLGNRCGAEAVQVDGGAGGLPGRVAMPDSLMERIVP